VVEKRKVLSAVEFRIVWLTPWTSDTQRELFLKNHELLGLGRQIGPKILGAFEVFLAKVQHPFRHSESLVHGFEYLVVFSTKKTFGFKA
jgi:hypothetical protein